MKPFVAYRLPNCSEVKYINQLTSNAHEASFCMMPFVSSRDYAPIYFTGTPTLIHPNELQTACVDISIHHHVSTKEEYMASFQAYLQKFKEKALGKAILSRIISTPLESTKLALLFQQLISTRPNAFVYLMFHPSYGYWLGASPEILLTSTSQQCKTVSLAGTSYHNTPWTDKEKHEQQVVTNYIENVLKANNIKDMQKTGPVTVTAGPVSHLKTTFNWQKNDYTQKIVSELHPTPAVCGIPKKDALSFILTTEKHERGFYAGYLGPIVDGNPQLYVNLRCLNQIQNQAYLFVGGGLTIGSVLENEWQETEHKAKSLLAIIENL